MAFMYNNTKDEAVKAYAAELVALLAKSQEAWGKKYGPAGEGYLFPFDPIVFDVLEHKVPRSGHNLYSVPFYTVHKVMAGLIDQYTHAGNEQAFTVVKGMAGWVQQNVEATIGRGGTKLWQEVLGTEWGGMNEALFNLYALTGDPAHLKTGRCLPHTSPPVLPPCAPAVETEPN